MATIASCPKCAKQLSMPEEFAATDRAECPECRAIFSLSETSQTTLPMVRVLDPAEERVSAETTANDAPPAAENEASDSLASNTAPLKSWEERLKNALALDSANDASPQVDAEASVADDETSATKPSPSFEFELDRAPAEAAEPELPAFGFKLPEVPSVPTPSAPSADAQAKASKKPLPTKTLADFAAKAEKPAIKFELPEVPELPKVDVAEEVVSATTATLADETVPASEPAAVQETPRVRGKRRSWSKTAAFAIGPVVGGVMGFYGLLLLRGTEADYLGLSKVLPAVMLPGDGGELLAESPPAEAGSPDGGVEEDEAVAELRRDEAVQPASASQSVPNSTVLNSTVAGRINATEFSELVDAAATAAGEFVEGDLSTADSIKRKGQAYMALCSLAEHFDFANQLGLAPAIQAKAKQAAQLFGHVTFKASVRQDLAHIAARWWGYEQRPTDGIFFSGRVEQVDPVGDITLCWVNLNEQSAGVSVPVLLSKPYEVGDQIGVVGSIVSDHAALPDDFSGDRLVRAEYSYALQVGK